MKNMKLEKLPIVRAIVDVLDDPENLLAGLLFAVAMFVAQWQQIGASARGTLMIGLVASGLMIIAGFSPAKIAAYFGQKYSHEAAQVAGKGIDLFEAISKIDIDDRVETAAQLALERKLAGLKLDPETVDRMQSLVNRLEAMLGQPGSFPDTFKGG
ncbi:MAG: hypothetical protein K8L91_01560 [Anaerolineae bacterium]|nr:hypothetical protein [Anaerolineae bacterium]